MHNPCLEGTRNILSKLFSSNTVKSTSNPNGPELLESLKLLKLGGTKCPPPSELTNYNPNAKTDVTLYSQL